MTPVRVQRQRTKGWRMPPNTVYVGRPTIHGNPWTMADAIHWRIPVNLRARWLVHQFEHDVLSDPTVLDEIRDRLAGKNLACWCPLDQPCHADSLLRVANRPRTTEAAHA